MERCIENFPEVKFFNGTRDGLDIKGTENIEFDEFIDRLLLKDYNISQIFDESFNKAQENINKEDIINFIKYNLKN